MKKTITLFCSIALLLFTTTSTSSNTNLVKNINKTTECPAAVITSFSPSSGPENTLITINGSNFSTTDSVAFGGVNTTFNIISDTEITAFIPAGTGASSTISIISTGGCTGTSATNFTLLASACVTAEIYISEIYDAVSGDYAVIELYNPTNTPVVIDNTYVIVRYGDIGNTAPNNTFADITGTIAPLSTFIIQMGSGSDCPSLSADFNIGTGINDNDEFELLKNGVIIDNVHSPNERGYSIIRNADATIPQTTYNNNDWSISSQEDCTDLDMHTADAIPDNTPNITHPTSQSICENGATTFTASEDSGTFSYQWKTLNASGNWVNVTNNTNYSGATTSTLTLNNVPVSFNNNQYYCEITSPSCTLITNAAPLEVNNMINPPTLECWQTATFNNTTCDWIITGTQDPIPTGLACWETATFNTTTCTWEITGTQDPMPTGLACWETTTFNNTTCAWEVTGTQDPMPTGLECWETATFNNATCAWEVTGTQDPMPIGLACWETTTFNNTTCSWVITGTPIDFDLSLSNITIVDNTITVNMTDTSINYTYIIDSGASQADPTFTDLANGLHSLVVQDENGCISKSISFDILVNLDGIVIPNGFSPNGDAHNEWFKIQGLYDIYTNHKLEIYNRYGTLIFTGNNDNKWYGKANKGAFSSNKTVPVGTYFYVLYLNNPNATKQRYIGWVYLNK